MRTTARALPARWLLVVATGACLLSCSNDGRDPQWLTDCVRSTSELNLPTDPTEDDVRDYCRCLTEGEIIERPSEAERRELDRTAQRCLDGLR